MSLASYRPALAFDPFAKAIRWAKAGDAAYRRTGDCARATQAAGIPLPADWRSYRAGLLRVRTEARFALHSMTPATPAEAVALVAYYRDRAEASGDPVAFRAARRRLLKVAKRPGAVSFDLTPLDRAAPV
ncbi:penicillin-binding protein [Methylobacterium sp. E-065]|uniref:penicillin-binding protein n=1 Tax=Methylobacterium sp. E-065 TaxID=2836583 RepID=UPI001FB87E4D|nr:penicillin-binding protein [Methylobacterium sp. E-065]MCJ2021172.1 penicillin-binding protein [Methylobacterium sp. E-065]